MTRCYLCGNRQRVGESYLKNGRHAVCLECADIVSVEGLCLLTDSDAPREMLLSLGFSWECD